MRPVFAFVAASLFVFAGLAGCLGGDEPAAEPVAPVEDPSAMETNATVDDGTTPMDADLGHMPHLHDYWMGKERVTIMDEEVEADQFEALFFTFFGIRSGTPGVGGTFFQPPEGALVYEGTGKMEIVATWSDPTITGAGIRYRTPASEEFSAVQALQPGAPLAIDVTPEMTDMPHDKESRWMFLLVPAQAGQTIVGNVHVRIDIIRVGDITLFPGHPELFQGQNTLVLFDGVATSSSQSFPARFAGAVTGNEQESGVRSSKVVPMETLSMTANVTITSTTSNVGSVSDLQFLYKPAGSFRWYRGDLLASDDAAGTYQFAWPVEMQETDSPYAKTSQWLFDLLIRTDPGTGQDLQGISDTQVDYTLQVVAYDSVVDGAEPRDE